MPPRGLDFAPLDQSSLKKSTPIVVVQHGLTGGTFTLTIYLFSNLFTSYKQALMNLMSGQFSAVHVLLLKKEV